ncbi:MAG TPA: hypothetical protein VMY37_40840, partial [Thermoguttaceae bacterium]|nr:hypothetical protein [Thermoguttaceae bacterium]
MFSKFLADLNALRDQTARFRRVMLHVHSPDSHDWATKAPDTTKNARSRFCSGEEGLDRFVAELQPHLECVAITDHMKCAFATQLSARTVGDREFMILPGMETNFRLEAPFRFAKIHLLVLLPEGSTPYDFERLFGGLKVPADDSKRTGHEEIAGIVLKEWTDRVHSNNGICVAAHVENRQGIRYRFRQAARGLLQLISAEDIEDAEKANQVPENLKQFLLRAGRGITFRFS